MSTHSVQVAVSGDAARAAQEAVPGLVSEAIASRIANHDATLWGPAAEAEASIRLGWTHLHREADDLLRSINTLREELVAEGKTRIVLAGMGGSSLAPEVITATYGVELTTLDSTDPDQVLAALAGDLSSTVLVVSSKSGGTVETDSQRRTFEFAFSSVGLDPRQHIVIVTDPGSPLEAASRESGYRAIFLSNPNVGGRFSALTAFGLVPSALAGVPVAELIEQASAAAPVLESDSSDNPALILGAAMAGTTPLRDKLVIVDEGSGIHGLGDWAEQLIAESTGKEGYGLLPVIVEGPDAPELQNLADDVLPLHLVSGDNSKPLAANAVSISGSLGGQFLLWEYATSIAGYLMKINPFDQPDVESAKTAARGLLDSQPEPEPALFEDQGIEVRATPGLIGAATTVQEAVTALLQSVDQRHGYLAVLAYLDRTGCGELAQVRSRLAAGLRRPVTFGWGPRFLHSTGQLHKGGPAVGAYLQITTTNAEDLEIPGRPFTFGTLISAQAAGDSDVLAERGRPVLKLHLTRGANAASIENLIATLTEVSENLEL